MCAPTKTRGTEIPNHMKRSKTSVVNGTEPEEPTNHMVRLRRKKIPNVIPGKTRAVEKVTTLRETFVSIAE